MLKSSDIDINQAQLIICDFDGLLMNTEEPYNESLSAAAKEIGLELSIDQLDDLRGLSMSLANASLKTFLASDQQLSELRAIADRHFHQKLEQGEIKPMPGAQELLQTIDEIPRLKKALASSASRNWLDKWKHWLEDNFKTILSRDDVKKAKPEPDLFLKAAEIMEVNPENCLVLEDSNTGVQAAKNAGMQVIQIAKVESDRHLVLESLYLVSDILKIR